MKKTVLTFGLLAGLVSTVLMLVSVRMTLRGQYSKSELIGYSGMVLAAIVMFFGIRSHREGTGQGRITFRRGLAVGALMTLVAATLYATTWLVLSTVRPGLTDEVAACIVKHNWAEGASAESQRKVEMQADTYRRLAKNPAINFAMAFVEPLPIGLAASLIAAAILRRKQA